MCLYICNWLGVRLEGGLQSIGFGRCGPSTVCIGLYWGNMDRIGDGVRLGGGGGGVCRWWCWTSGVAVE